MKSLILGAFLALPLSVFAQDPSTCPMHKGGMTHDHAAAVDERGDRAMGFSHEKSVHHFRLLQDGGAIEVTANAADDGATRDEIRTHLSHIAQMFTKGDFDLPMFIHDQVPPGVPVMKSKRATITYTFEATPTGGRVRIASTDKDAVDAIHQFLAFQIEDHRTGDSKALETQ